MWYRQDHVLQSHTGRKAYVVLQLSVARFNGNIPNKPEAPNAVKSPSCFDRNFSALIQKYLSGFPAEYWALYLQNQLIIIFFYLRALQKNKIYFPCMILVQKILLKFSIYCNPSWLTCCCYFNTVSSRHHFEACSLAGIVFLRFKCKEFNITYWKWIIINGKMSCFFKPYILRCYIIAAVCCYAISSRHTLWSCHEVERSREWW